MLLLGLLVLTEKVEVVVVVVALRLVVGGVNSVKLLGNRS